MITTIADPYLAQNAGRRYPLADDTPYTGVTRDTAILDFRCTAWGVPAGTLPRAWLVNVTSATVGGKAVKRLTVNVRNGTTVIDVLQFDVRKDLAAGYHCIRATGAQGRVLGEMTVSADAAADAIIPNGSKDLPFAWSTVSCDALKVRSLQSANSADAAKDESDPAARNATAVLTGEIVLAEGRNTEPYLDGAHLRVGIHKGAGLGENCQTLTVGQSCDNVLFTVNGERPGSDGNLRLTGENGISVTARPEAHALEIRLDTARSPLAAACESPCKGD